MFQKYSYRSKDQEKAINKLVGKSFGVLDRFKLMGIGSQRFVVISANREIEALFETQTQQRFTNIELRPSGLIFHFRVKLDNYILVLPFYSLSAFKSGTLLNVYSGKYKLSLIPAHNQTLKHSFIEKLWKLKSENS